MDYSLKLKCLNDGFVSYKLVAFGSKDIKGIVHPKKENCVIYSASSISKPV